MRHLFEVVPYVHNILHDLGKSQGRMGWILFSVPCKLALPCKRDMGSQVRKYCMKKHEYQYVACAIAQQKYTSVAYRIPEGCGHA